MVKKCFIVLLSVFLSACSGVSQPVAVPPETIVLEPAATPAVMPVSASPETSLIISPEPTTDPNLFRDDFAGSLDAQWKWVREDPLNWSLTATPGALQIMVSGGYLSAHTNSNLLLRPAPTGNFQIATQIDFRPEANFQFAGLIIYESDTDFVQAGRGYCRTFECVGEGLYLNYYKKGTAIKPDYGQRYKEIDPILLRLSRREDIYTFEASTDGRVWFVIGSHIADLQPLKIGLVTGQKMNGRSLPANFDDFEVRSLP